MERACDLTIVLSALSELLTHRGRWHDGLECRIVESSSRLTTFPNDAHSVIRGSKWPMPTPSLLCPMFRRDILVNSPYWVSHGGLQREDVAFTYLMTMIVVVHYHILLKALGGACFAISPTLYSRVPGCVRQQVLFPPVWT